MMPGRSRAPPHGPAWRQFLTAQAPRHHRRRLRPRFTWAASPPARTARGRRRPPALADGPEPARGHGQVPDQGPRRGQFTSSFDAVLTAEGIRIVASPPDPLETSPWRTHPRVLRRRLTNLRCYGKAGHHSNRISEPYRFASTSPFRGTAIDNAPVSRLPHPHHHELAHDQPASLTT
jgi:hypothetical protein